MSRRPTFLSLFSGCGGLDLGFIEAGFEPVAAFDNWPVALENYAANIGHHIRCIDLSEGRLPTSYTCDVVIAGSPCQGFSTAGKRRLNDSRNHLLAAGADIAVRICPRVIVMENVLGALAGAHSQHWKSAEAKFQRSGYRTQTVILDARASGLPQMRKRAVLVAWRGRKEFRWQQALPPLSTVRNCISGIGRAQNHEPHLLQRGSREYLIARRIGQGQKLCDVRAGPASVHTWHIPEVFGRTTESEREVLEELMRLRRRLRRRSYGDADPVSPKELQRSLGRSILKDVTSLLKKGYLKQTDSGIDLKHGFNGKFRRLIGDGSSYTVDTRFGEPTYFLHPEENRGFSVRETARLQGFPDHFAFSGSQRDQFRMLGNAVPPPMGNFLAKCLKSSVLK